MAQLGLSDGDTSARPGVNAGRRQSARGCDPRAHGSRDVRLPRLWRVIHDGSGTVEVTGRSMVEAVGMVTAGEAAELRQMTGQEPGSRTFRVDPNRPIGPRIEVLEAVVGKDRCRDA